MTKSGIVLVLTLLIGGLAGYLQREDVAGRRALPRIDSLALSRSDDGRRLTIRGSHAEDCAAPLQSVVNAFPQNLDIQLFRDIPATAVCGMQATRFQFELALDEAAEASALIINDEVWLQDDSAGDAYFKASLFAARIEQATRLPSQDAGLQLRLQGTQAVGCQLPELFTWRQTGDGLTLGVYNAMDAATVCAAVQLDIDETVRPPATELPADTLFLVNGILISELETQNVSDIDKVLTNINQVDVTVAGEQISLAIEGEHPDGCDYPVRVDQSRDGNRIEVEVYREIPADVFCPMILQPYRGTIQIDGSIAAGEYHVQVNSHSQNVSIPGA